MFKLIGKDIRITRGDTGVLVLSVTVDGAELSKSDYTGTFSVKRDIDDDDYVISKEIDNQGQLVLESADTAFLEPGTYVYDIQIVSGAQVATVGPAKFRVEGDVTRNE